MKQRKNKLNKLKKHEMKILSIVPIIKDLCNLKVVIFCFILIVFSNCNNSSKNIVDKVSAGKDDELSLNSLTLLLEKDLDSLPTVEYYTQSDTVLLGDEGVSWNAKNFYFDGKLIFIAESNWNNLHKVKRITILNRLIKNDSIYVGQIFKNFKHLVNNEIPTSPDGYLFIKYSDFIYIELDISKQPTDSKIFYGVNEIGEIPDFLKIKSIVIRNPS